MGLKWSLVISRQIRSKGSFTNYVENFLAFFDHSYCQRSLWTTPDQIVSSLNALLKNLQLINTIFRAIWDAKIHAYLWHLSWKLLLCWNRAMILSKICWIMQTYFQTSVLVKIRLPWKENINSRKTWPKSYVINDTCISDWF